jgi:hypothetical protein
MINNIVIYRYPKDNPKDIKVYHVIRNTVTPLPEILRSLRNLCMCIKSGRKNRIAKNRYTLKILKKDENIPKCKVTINNRVNYLIRKYFKNI